MFNISEFVSSKTGTVLFAHKDGQYYCSESWQEAYKKIFKSRCTIEYINLNNDYSTTRVSARADSAKHTMFIHVPVECGNIAEELKITYSVESGLSAERVSIAPSGGDLPSGGSADWNAEEGEAGHIKNRPFYKTIKFGEILPETTIPQTLLEDGAGYVTTPVILKEGQSYTFTYDGTEYECTGIAFEMYGLSTILLGNTVAAGIGTDNGLPFLFGSAQGVDISDGAGIYGLIFFMDGNTSASFSIKGMMETVHTIPEEYLPNSVDVKPVIFRATEENGKKYYTCNFTADELWDISVDAIQRNTRVIDGDSEYAVSGVNKCLEPLYGKTIQFTVDFNAPYYDLVNSPSNSMILTLMGGNRADSNMYMKLLCKPGGFLSDRSDGIMVPSQTIDNQNWNYTVIHGFKQKSGGISVSLFLNIYQYYSYAEADPEYYADINEKTVKNALLYNDLAGVALYYKDSYEAETYKTMMLDRVEYTRDGYTPAKMAAAFIMRPDENGKYARITFVSNSTGTSTNVNVEWLYNPTSTVTIKSPGGKRFTLTVDDSGTLSAVETT